jgi:hypothetical protein
MVHPAGRFGQSRQGGVDQRVDAQAHVAKMIGLDGRGCVSGILSDLLLFSCLATFVAGIVIAVARLLS